MTRTPHIGWKYGTPLDNDKTKVLCSFWILQEYLSMRNLLIQEAPCGYSREEIPCDKVPAPVGDEIKELGKEKRKR